MAETTGISWAQSTFNIVWGCDEVPLDPCCTHCYARDFSKRLGMDLWGKEKPRKTMSEHYWNDPGRWNKKAEAEGRRHRVFCSSMADVYEDHKDLVEPRRRLWEVIARTPALDWMLLTKRPENMEAYSPPEWKAGWPKNVWAGTTVGTQEWADKRCPIITKIPAAIRWLSIEPLFGPINLDPWLKDISWVIVGGESHRSKARPMDPEWVHGLIDQCKKHDVPFFFKQKGTVLAREMGCKAEKGDDPAEWPESFKIQEFPKVA